MMLLPKLLFLVVFLTGARARERLDFSEDTVTQPEYRSVGSNHKAHLDSTFNLPASQGIVLTYIFLFLHLIFVFIFNLYSSKVFFLQ